MCWRGIGVHPNPCSVAPAVLALTIDFAMASGISRRRRKEGPTAAPIAGQQSLEVWFYGTETLSWRMGPARWNFHLSDVGLHKSWC